MCVLNVGYTWVFFCQCCQYIYIWYCRLYVSLRFQVINDVSGIWIFCNSVFLGSIYRKSMSFNSSSLSLWVSLCFCFVGHWLEYLTSTKSMFLLLLISTSCYHWSVLNSDFDLELWTVFTYRISYTNGKSLTPSLT